MHPFIYLGPLRIGTFGLMVWVAFVAAMFILQSEFRRRRISADAQTVILWLAFSGMVGAKLYHVLQDAERFFAAPLRTFFSPSGFAWFGGFLAGIATLVLLARHYRIPLLLLMDAASPPATMGYAIGRIGCLLSGDGDYGVPTDLPWGMSFPHGLVPTTEVCLQYGRAPSCGVHPTPIYEFLVWTAIFFFLRHESRSAVAQGWPAGVILGEQLLLTGIARFLVEFIRLNPNVLLGMTNAQLVSLASVAAGAILLWLCPRRPAREGT